MFINRWIFLDSEFITICHHWASTLESVFCALLWIISCMMRLPIYTFSMYLWAPCIKWPKISVLLSNLPPWLEMFILRQMVNRLRHCMFSSNLMASSYYNIVLFTGYGRKSPTYSFIVANYPSCCPHSDPVDYCTSSENGYDCWSYECICSLLVYVLLIVKRSVHKESP